MEINKYSPIKLFALLAILVILPRLPLVLRDPIHYDSGAVVQVLRTFIDTGHYYPSRHPGSPLAEFAFSGLQMMGEKSGIPPHYLTNSLALLATIFTFYFLYKILLQLLDSKQAMLLILVLNFHHQMFLYGGATSDMPLLLFFMTTSAYSFLKGSFNWAIFLAWLGCYCRIQGLALLLPLLFFWFLEAREKQKIIRASLCVFVLILVMAPGFLVFGLDVFSPGKFHAYTISSFQKLVAALYRALNIMGPLGTVLLSALFLYKLREKDFFRVCLRSIFFWVLLYTLVVFRFAPMEAYYLLPVVFISVGFWFKFHRILPYAKTLNMIFLISMLLSNFVQVRLHPWKLPPIEIFPGTIEAHYKNLFVIRGGG